MASLSVVGILSIGFCAGHAIGAARRSGAAEAATPPASPAVPVPETAERQASAAPSAVPASAPPASAPPASPGGRSRPDATAWAQFLHDIIVTPAGCRAVERFVKTKAKTETVNKTGLTLELNLRDIKIACVPIPVCVPMRCKVLTLCGPFFCRFFRRPNPSVSRPPVFTFLAYEVRAVS